MARPKRAARKTKRAYHHGNLRRALLDEALATIRAEGVGALTLREIGARLGVSRTALYRHFADKQALLAAVATEGFRTLRQQLVAAWEEGGRGPAAFTSMGEVYVRFAVANPSHYRVMFGGFVDPKASEPDLAAEAAGTFQALVDALAALKRDRLVRRRRHRKDGQVRLGGGARRRHARDRWPAARGRRRRGPDAIRARAAADRSQTRHRSSLGTRLSTSLIEQELRRSGETDLVKGCERGTSRAITRRGSHCRS